MLIYLEKHAQATEISLEKNSFSRKATSCVGSKYFSFDAADVL